MAMAGDFSVPYALLDKLRQLNVKVTLNGDKLRLEAPKGVLTPEMKEAIRQYKPALIALLEAEEARRLLETQGWVAVRSKVLGETIMNNDVINVKIEILQGDKLHVVHNLIING